MEILAAHIRGRRAEMRGLLLESFIPEELYQLVEFFHRRAVELLSVDLTADLAVSIKQNGVLCFCENLEISLDEFDVFHLYYLFLLFVP